VDLEQRIRSICDSVGDEDHVNLSTPQEVELRHVGFGLVMGEDDKKLKSREGEALRLRDLLDEALLRSGLELEKRQLQYSATGDQNSKDRLLTDQEVSDAARVIGM
jgi:arginyl-tRNA synthetase